MEKNPFPFWSIPTGELLEKLSASPGGLTADHAAEKLARHGANRLNPELYYHSDRA